MTGPEIEHLIQLLSKIPGLGPRSARRMSLHLMKKKATVLEPLANALTAAAKVIQSCQICGNLDSRDPCTICINAARDQHQICIVQDVSDLWAIERSGSYRGLYHVLGGILSALAGVRPEDLSISGLLSRISPDQPQEIILALSATVEGQTTAHYIADRLREHSHINLTRLGHGLPVGGEVHYLDSGTLTAALRARQNARS